MKVTLKEVEVEVALKIGASLEEAVELCGGEVVFAGYKEWAEKRGAAVVKRYMRKEYDETRIAAEMEEWTPASEKVKIVDKVARITKALEKLSDVEREALKAMIAEA